jgi:hypothetical protein
VAEGVYEVAVTATVQTKIQDKTVFLVEAKQAGIFEIRNVPEDQMGGVIGIACPQIIYPYLRGNVADVVTRAGFLPCTWPKSTSRPCTSSSKRLPQHRPKASCPSKLTAIADSCDVQESAARQKEALEASFSCGLCANCYQNSGMKILVIGAGAWGTAMAISAATHPSRAASASGRVTRRRRSSCRPSAPTAAICPASAFRMRSRWSAAM